MSWLKRKIVDCPPGECRSDGVDQRLVDQVEKVIGNLELGVETFE